MLTMRQMYTLFISRKRLPRESVIVLDVRNGEGVLVRKEIAYQFVPGLTFTEEGDKIMDEIKAEVDRLVARRIRQAQALRRVARRTGRRVRITGLADTPTTN